MLLKASQEWATALDLAWPHYVVHLLRNDLEAKDGGIKRLVEIKMAADEKRATISITLPRKLYAEAAAKAERLGGVIGYYVDTLFLHDLQRPENYFVIHPGKNARKPVLRL